MDGFCTESGKNGKVMNFTCRSGFNHQTCRGSQSFLDQMQVNGRRGQQRRNGNVIGVHLAIGQDQDVAAILDRVHSLGA